MKPSPVLIKLQGLQNPVTSTVKNTMFCVLQLYKFVGFKFASYSAKKQNKKLLILSGSDGGALKCMHAHLCQV